MTITVRCTAREASMPFRVLLLLLGLAALGERLSCEAWAISSDFRLTTRTRRRLATGHPEMEDLHVEKVATKEVVTENKKFKRELSVSTSLMMPFSADVAFDAFSNLPRQPTWSLWLRTVEYVDTLAEGTESRNPREVKWTVGLRGFRFSWNSIYTRVERPRIIEWESYFGDEEPWKS